MLVVLPIPLLGVVAAFALPAQSHVTNLTIDDTLAHYAADGELWNARSANDGCTSEQCTAQPDPRYAYRGTWHDHTTFPGKAPSNITFSFNGTAVYIFFMLANRVAFEHTNTHLAFHLDGASVGRFDHIHDPHAPVEGFLYNQLVFAADALPHVNHTLVIQCSAQGESASLALFDYAVYTAEIEAATSASPSPGSKTSTGAQGAPGTRLRQRGSAGLAAGCAAAGLLVGASLTAAAAALWTARRRRLEVSSAPSQAYLSDIQHSASSENPLERRLAKATGLGILLPKSPGQGSSTQSSRRVGTDIPPLYAP